MDCNAERGTRRAEQTTRRPVPRSHFRVPRSPFSSPCAASRRSRRTGGELDCSMELATLAGGCFWCLEAVFEQLRGVTGVTSGYAGGHVPHPSYEAVCTGTTVHAAVLQIAFDPTIVTYRELLEVFFTLHDPTTLNRQGPDTGTQYRSAIFYHTAEQRATAEQVIKELEAGEVLEAPRVTQVCTSFDIYIDHEFEHSHI